MTRHGLMHIVFLCVFIVAHVQSAVVDTNHTAGLRLLRQGDFERAAELLHDAYRSHPSDPVISADYAAVAPCSVAVSIYSSIAANTKVSDSLRAVAYGNLGDYSFVHSAFRTAAEKYKAASALYPDHRYLHLAAGAYSALNDTAGARLIWNKLAADVKSGYRSQARYHLGLLDMNAGAYNSALRHLSLCGPVDTARSWTIAAAAAKLECAIRLGKKDSAAVFEKQLLPLRKELLETDLLDLAEIGAPDDRALKSSQTPAPVAGPSSGSTYTLQVGAFGSAENAANLEKRLSARFRDVSVLPVTISDQVFYRVRVGSFANDSAAKAFGKDSLSTSGITFKVVVK